MLVVNPPSTGRHTVHLDRRLSEQKGIKPPPIVHPHPAFIKDKQTHRMGETHLQ